MTGVTRLVSAFLAVSQYMTKNKKTKEQDKEKQPYVSNNQTLQITFDLKENKM